MVSRRGILAAGGGGFGAGLLLLVGGLIVKHSQAKMLAACSSGPGRFGQALDPNTARQCGNAQDLSSMATGAIWIGAFLLVIAVGACIAFFATAGVTASRKPKVVVPAGGVARSAGPSRGAPAPSGPAKARCCGPLSPWSWVSRWPRAKRTACRGQGAVMRWTTGRDSAPCAGARPPAGVTFPPPTSRSR